MNIQESRDDMDDGPLKRSTKDLLEETLGKLENVWEELGLTDEQCKDRTNHFHIHVMNLCEKIIEDEIVHKQRMETNIAFNVEKILEFSKEMNMMLPDLGESLTLVKRNDILEEAFKVLSEQRQERLQALNDLLVKDEALSEMLDTPSLIVERDHVPSFQILQDLESHISTLEDLKAAREEEFSQMKVEIMKFLELLEHIPDDQIIRDIVENDDVDIHLTVQFLKQVKSSLMHLEFQVKENLFKSQELRDKIQNLWQMLEVEPDDQLAFTNKVPKHTPSAIGHLSEELDRLKNLRSQNLPVFLNRLHSELVTLWNECYIGDEERTLMSKYEGDTSDAALEAHEQEVDRWREYRHLNQELLGRVADFLTLFGKMEELEDRVNRDPKRLFNTRGGALLKEEKERKQVVHALPRLQESMLTSANDYFKRKGRYFMVSGAPIEEFVAKLWQRHDAQREVLKAKKPVVSKIGQSSVTAMSAMKATPISSQKQISNIGKPNTAPSMKRGLSSANVSPVKRHKMNAAASGSVFGTPLQMKQTSDIAPRKLPLREQNASPSKIPMLDLSDVTLHTTFTYDNFEDKLQNDSMLNSTAIDQ